MAAMLTEQRPAVRPLPDFAGTDNWEVQREIEALAARLAAANGSLGHEQQRQKAMGEHLRQVELQMRQRQAQGEEQRAELNTEAHLRRMLQQSDVRPLDAGT